MLVKTKNFDATTLARFKELQSLSFSILENMAASLTEGQSEKEVGAALVRQYRDAGAKSFFHLPVVLFGERTALPGNWKIGNFYPKSRTLQKGDSVILDAAPVFDGYMIDTSYSCCFGENPEHAKMMAGLEQFRVGVCDAVNNGQTFKEIADWVAVDIRSMGYEPVHTKHPGAVFGHRAVKTANMPVKWRLKGSDGLSLSWFVMKVLAAAKGLARSSPLWNGSPQSDHAPHDGLWLVEPHTGDGPVGAKWEEILVIENGRAYWLGDDLPHVRQWAQIAAGQSYGPRAA